MTNPRKRSAESAAVSEPVYTATAAPSKKRKLGKGQRYYAVRVGLKPGVYMTYPECESQIRGFKGAVHKSFDTREEADAFVAGEEVGSKDKTPRFYAVAVGKETGIFDDWAKVQNATTGTKNPKFRRFDTYESAKNWIKEFGHKATIDALNKNETGQACSISAPSITEPTAASLGVPVSPAPDCIDIYTDGSSRSNGQKGARAGIGVFFGKNDARNISERLKNDPQTNQRAELMAILRALGAAPLNQDVQIITDSKYSINCVTEWAVDWERREREDEEKDKEKGGRKGKQGRRDWRAKSGESVKNQDIIRAVREQMLERTKNGSNTFFKWIKGHSADPRNIDALGNLAADNLAVQGAKMER